MGLPKRSKLSRRSQVTAASSGHMLSGNCGDMHQEGKGGRVGNRPGDGKEGVGSKGKRRWVSWLCALKVSLHSF